MQTYLCLVSNQSIIQAVLCRLNTVTYFIIYPRQRERQEQKTEQMIGCLKVLIFLFVTQ